MRRRYVEECGLDVTAVLAQHGDDQGFGPGVVGESRLEWADALDEVLDSHARLRMLGVRPEYFLDHRAGVLDECPCRLRLRVQQEVSAEEVLAALLVRETRIQ